MQTKPQHFDTRNTCIVEWEGKVLAVFFCVILTSSFPLNVEQILVGHEYFVRPSWAASLMEEKS